jgi:predicted enzyme related to lactoylglutathione lyase
MNDTLKPGTIGWHDLTVDQADAVRDFYAEVVGWRAEPVDMGGYADFSMIPPATGEPAAGICWRRGVNAALPSQWLMYIIVEDLDRSIERCVALGGNVVCPPRTMGQARFCVIADPAGAVCGLFQQSPA